MTEPVNPLRRRFLKHAALSAGGAAAALALPPALAGVLTAPLPKRTGSIADVEHIVLFMQENRAFDHYFGTLAGVRGFGDHVPPPLPGGRNTFYQPCHGKTADYLLPFHLDTLTTRSMCVEASAMNNPVDLAMWNDGRYNAWNTARSPRFGMGYYNRGDLPFYYALADAFTICDQYFCSTLTETDPNRLHFFSGTSGLSAGASAVLSNAEAHVERGLRWTTYAERLQKAGIDWKVYQEQDNFDDNALSWFATFKRAKPGNPLFDRGMARVSDLVTAFADDVHKGTLPQVSWIVAPAYQSEHPDYRPAYGEDLSSRLLEVLARHPDTFAKTAFILSYDENGGFFDHLPPPTPPTSPETGQSTIDASGEVANGAPIGLGFRVPMIIVSPWTRGGWVCSRVFDHTSMLRFVEARFGVRASNISAWRRAVCGDLTSAFDFGGENAGWPKLPSTAGYRGQADAECDLLPNPTVPAVQSVPTQESGVKRARALPYVLDVRGSLDAAARQFRLRFANDGTAAAVLQAYDLAGAAIPRRYTVGPGTSVSAQWHAGAAGTGRYALEVHGPNGFLRSWAGEWSGSDTGVDVSSTLQPATGSIVLAIRNAGSNNPATLVVRNAYAAAQPRTYTVAPGASVDGTWQLEGQANWYDLTVSIEGAEGWSRRLAGHLENGRASFTDPGARA